MSGFIFAQHDAFEVEPGKLVTEIALAISAKLPMQHQKHAIIDLDVPATAAGVAILLKGEGVKLLHLGDLCFGEKGFAALTEAALPKWAKLLVWKYNHFDKECELFLDTLRPITKGRPAHMPFKAGALVVGVSIIEQDAETVLVTLSAERLIAHQRPLAVLMPRLEPISGSEKPVLLGLPPNIQLAAVA